MSGADESVVDILTQYGERLGIAFQLADDVLDIASDSHESGKTPGTDLREGIPTLPVLRLRERAARRRAGRGPGARASCWTATYATTPGTPRRCAAAGPPGAGAGAAGHRPVRRGGAGDAGAAARVLREGRAGGAVRRGGAPGGLRVRPAAPTRPIPFSGLRPQTPAFGAARPRPQRSDGLECAPSAPVPADERADPYGSGDVAAPRVIPEQYVELLPGSDASARRFGQMETTTPAPIRVRMAAGWTSAGRTAAADHGGRAHMAPNEAQDQNGPSRDRAETAVPAAARRRATSSRSRWRAWRRRPSGSSRRSPPRATRSCRRSPRRNSSRRSPRRTNSSCPAR